MFCRKCGTELQEDARYCKVCGTPVGGEDISRERQTLSRNVQERREKKGISVLTAVLLGICLLLTGVIISGFLFLRNGNMNRENDYDRHSDNVQVGEDENVREDEETNLKDSENPTMGMRISQIDASDYPNITLYVEAYNLITEEWIEFPNKASLRIFQETDDGSKEIKKKKIEKLNKKEALKLCMVADISGSMYESMDKTKEYMCEFVSEMQFDVGDEVNLIPFDSYVYAHGFSNKREDVLNKIRSLYAEGSTALYDALYVAVGEASKASGMRCVIAFTDGDDNESSMTAQDVIDYAKQFHIPVYLIAIGEYVEETVLNDIAEATGGSYYNMEYGGNIKEIYQSIYTRNKNMYAVSYKSIYGSDRMDNDQKVRLLYNDGVDFAEQSSTYNPAALQDTDDEYRKLLTDTDFSSLDVEEEVKRIQSIYYDDIQDGINDGSYTVDDVNKYVKAYYDRNGDVRRIDVNKAYDNSDYNKCYYYENGKLIFAYLEGEDSHRLYYYDEQLFRWRYAKNAVKYTEAENHDIEDSADFRKWGNYALNMAQEVFDLTR